AGPKAFQNLQLAEAAMSAKPGADEAQLAAAASAAGQLAPAATPAEPSPATAVAAAGPELPSGTPRVPASPLTAAPLAAAMPTLTVAPANLPAPAMPRSEPAQLTVLPAAAREIGSHMELIKVAANIYELKMRAAPEPAPAAMPATQMAATAVVPKSAAQAMPQANKVRMARLEIANGNGVNGMARRFRSLLGQMGIPVDRLSNDKPYKQVVTTIQYSPGFEKQAASLQKALQGKAQLTGRILARSEVRLVLGKDAQISLSAATEAAGLSLVALQDDDRN
ncbi:MAG TPA: LytR C-terminal domain-containing protein, partial [Pseudoduganella sp.]